MNLFSDTIAPVNRSAEDELFLVRFLASPLPENPESSSVSGAYVNCWVNAGDLRTAEKEALEAVTSQLWKATKFEHWEIVCRRCYVEDPDLDEAERRDFLECLDEALEDGIALSFNCWSPDAPDADEDPKA